MHEPGEDLAVIRRLMEDSHRVVHDNGAYFLVWGVLATVGLVLTYLAVVGAVALEPRWSWGGVLVVGWGLSMWLGWRGHTRSRVRTVGRRYLGVLWLTCAVTLTVVSVAAFAGAVVSANALPGLVSVVIAMPFAGTSVLTGERWVGVVAAGWWLGGAVMLVVPGLYTLPMLALMTLLLEVVPGVVFYRRSKGMVVGTAP